MINRTRVASLVAALALVSTCAIAEARPGGFGGGRAVSSHGGFHRFAPTPRPVVRVAPVPRPAATGGVARHRHVRHDGRDFRRHHRHKFHHRDTAAGVSVIYGSSEATGMEEFSQPLSVGAIAPIAPTAATAGDDLAASGPICRSADQVVPRERGGQTIVTVTRCYPPNE
jgi:hypothetical protein